MTFYKGINRFRRRLMTALTRNIRSSGDGMIKVGPPKKILISHPNKRLGNLLLLTPLLQELESEFPLAEIDLFIAGRHAPVLFANYQQIKNTIELPGKPFKELLGYAKSWIKLRKTKYDMAITFQAGSSSGKLGSVVSRASNKFFGELENYATEEVHYAKKPVILFREYLRSIGIVPSEREIKPLKLRLDANEVSDAKKILDSKFPNKKPVIALFTFATGEKMYQKEWWLPFYEGLIIALPEYNFMEILPFENVSQIDFKCESFYSKDVREITAVIKHCAVFIGADSGMMHLASASGVPVIGLFGVTDPEKYGPYNAGSLGVRTTQLKDPLELIGIVQKILEPN